MHITDALPDTRQCGLKPTLPKGMERDGFVALIDAVAPAIGVGNAALSTFRAMISSTRPSAFKNAQDEPCCYKSQTEIAKERHVTAARIREHERELQRAGLIELRTMANGARSGYAKCGVFFSVAIARVEEFIAMRHEIDARRREHGRLRGLRSSHLRHIKSCLAEMIERYGQCSEITAIAQAFEDWPSHDRLHRMSLEDLADHEADADALCAAALDLLQSGPESSAEPHENERSYIQDTTQESINVVCNASDKTSADKSAHSIASDDPPNGGSSCKEKNDEGVERAHNSEILSKIPLQHFLPLASEDMRMHLDIRRQGRSTLHLHDFTVAAQHRLPELGISSSAWTDAVATMGEETATWCVLITDAKSTGPAAEVSSPGGYLRGMTKKYRQGNLNIVGSLIGLSERRACH